MLVSVAASALHCDFSSQTAGSSVVTLTIGKRQGGEISQEATGSGIIWDKAGHIVTNYHCIQQPLNDRTGTQALL